MARSCLGGPGGSYNRYHLPGDPAPSSEGLYFLFPRTEHGVTFLEQNLNGNPTARTPGRPIRTQVICYTEPLLAKQLKLSSAALSQLQGAAIRVLFLRGWFYAAEHCCRKRTTRQRVNLIDKNLPRPNHSSRRATYPKCWICSGWSQSPGRRHTPAASLPWVCSRWSCPRKDSAAGRTCSERKAIWLHETHRAEGCRGQEEGAPAPERRGYLVKVA